nr:immunoglobulin light chain junction region [Macaca mulatta]
YMQGIEFPLTF